MTSIKSISFQNVVFEYDEERVLNGFECSVEQGEHLVIKGESGSGKSTVLRLLLGFVRPQKGAIQVRTTESETITPGEIRPYTAWLPQDLDLGDGSLNDVLEFLFSFETNKDREMKPDRIDSLLEAVDLSPSLRTRDLSNLSTGQRQRAGVVICHILDKPVMLLDEPTSALDQQNKERVADLLLQNKDRLVLSTSHDPAWLEHASSVTEIQSESSDRVVS